MPPYAWPTDPITQVQHFEARHRNRDAGALFSWAACAVDCLHYLDDSDRAFDASPIPISGHRPDIVDVAHARWATGTCITALDLCAAGLGRAFCGHSGSHELKLRHFDTGSAKKNPRRAQLPAQALQWIDAVLGDPDYATVKSARNWLTHSRLPRHFVLNAGGPPERLSLQLATGRLQVRRLVELSRDLPTRHVTALLNCLAVL